MDRLVVLERDSGAAGQPDLWGGDGGAPGDAGAAQLEAARGTNALRPSVKPLVIVNGWSEAADVVLFEGDCETLLGQMPAECVQLIVSSPPYNIGKSYESKSPIKEYLDWQEQVLRDCVRVLKPGGNLCWQVGNYIERKTNEVIPLDALFWPILHGLGLRSRNRIVWTFEHGLHASTRFSGRHETILWFQKGEEGYFDVDPVRVPQKYPNKRYFKGPRKGQLSGNPAGKNPGDVWAIPNVKHNHPEKTSHPCSFPIELAERLVLSMSRPGDLVLDPFGGVGSTAVAAALHGRRAAMAELVPEYITEARARLERAQRGELLARPMGRPVFQAPAAA